MFLLGSHIPILLIGVAPTTEFNEFNNTTLAIADLDTNAERLAIDDLVSTGGGNELDFGNVNISGGQTDSSVKCLSWQASAYGTNSQVENFRFYLSSNGWDQAGTVVKFATWKLDVTSEWEQAKSAPLTGEATLPETEPAQNVYQGGDGSTTSITSGDNDTTTAIAMYVAVDGSETAGTYKGTDASFEFQFTFTYDYF